MSTRVQQISPGAGEDKLDIRIALVLYGGVSLAIYENGVTRCFADIVRRKGVFSILLDLLDARAQVDTIAGTSAGGINGLLLAAALESGADFSETMKLWRDLGDLGDLLRDLHDSDSSESLLRGETYYQEELIKAFRKYCTPPANPAEEYEDEMDVFITGTDLDGQKQCTFDALGDPVFEKEHRVVFQLQHRPNRKALGYRAKGKPESDPQEQGTILGTIARITSSFPAAFPPFRLAHLDAEHGEHRENVQKALCQNARSSIGQIDERSFVDGGLLDNKPFGPVLEAIFHRMPTDVVDRRLFYVEPDPEPEPRKPDPSRHVPLNVALESVTAIPSHESIWGDLQMLAEHNARVRWLKRLKQECLGSLADPSGLEKAANLDASSPYWQTRVESLARSFFLADDGLTPTANKDVSNPAHRALADAIGVGIRPYIKRSDKDATEDRKVAPGPLLNSFDVDFHLRRSFHVLYELFGRLEQAGLPADEYASCRTAMRLVGRIIKTQKLIRDMMLILRSNIAALVDLAGPAAIPSTKEELDAAAILIANLFRLFLKPDAPHWAALGAYLRLDEEELRALGENWKSFFSSTHLSEVADESRKATDLGRLTSQSKAEDLSREDLSVLWTILDEIEEVTRRVVRAFCRGCPSLSEVERAAERFAAIDVLTYPLEFVAGVYELDEIEYVRISPQDAQRGFSKGAAEEKIAGDQLFHFSSFLRKDWRSNDILQGRFDGICQIVDALLEPSARTLRRVKRSWSSRDDLFAPKRRLQVAPHCSEKTWSHLAGMWRNVAAKLEKVELPDDGAIVAKSLADAWKSFTLALIQVGQEDTFREMFPQILEDHYYQEMAFGNLGGPDNVTATSSRTAIEGSAKKAATDRLGTDPSKWWDMFKDLALGSQTLEGRESAVPPHIVGEYLTHAYLLLWGMTHRSLGAVGRRVMEQKTARAVLRQPPAFLNLIFYLMQRSETLALSSVVASAGLLLGVAATGFYLRKMPVLVAGFLALVIFMWIVNWATPRMRRYPTWVGFGALLVALLVGILAVLVGQEVLAMLRAHLPSSA